MSVSLSTLEGVQVGNIHENSSSAYTFPREVRFENGTFCSSHRNSTPERPHASGAYPSFAFMRKQASTGTFLPYLMNLALLLPSRQRTTLKTYAEAQASEKHSTIKKASTTG